MGKWKAFVPIVLALVVAAGGSMFLYKWLQLKTAPKQVVQVEAQAVPVVVAASRSRLGDEAYKRDAQNHSLPEGESAERPQVRPGISLWGGCSSPH